jgi:16S rRNA (uracil1498-N3)-methyltransferase
VNLFYQPLIPEGINILDAEESRHCVKVLRHQTGDLINITDGKGFFYKAVIVNASPTACLFRIEETVAAPSRSYSIHIAIAPTKNADRIEWFIEKAVELSIDRITLMDCEHSERTFQKLERLNKIALSAMKQSLKATLPEIIPLTDFKTIVNSSQEEQRFIAYVDTLNPLALQHVARKNNSYLVLIGPEGDFSQEELDFAINHHFTKVSLGESRLRTETAGMAACHILNLVNN